MSWLLRSVATRALVGTRARKRSLVALVALPLAATFVAGTALGAAAGGADSGVVAIVASIPVGLVVGAAAGRVLLGAAESVRRTHAAFWIVDKVEPLRLAVEQHEPQRINIVHPAIDLKHFFAGFIAVFNLARRLAERGHRVRLIALEGGENPRDWRARLARYEGLGDSARALEVVFAADRSLPIAVSPDDAMIATHWTAAYVAAAAVSRLGAARFLYLIQEYEPFIFPMGSASAMARASYDLPHAALFSTDLLRDWFAAHEVGVFATGQEAGERDSATFRNAITSIGPVSPDELRRPGARRLLFYARPEEHAARNLFEIGAMALDEAVADGRFGDWELVGIGTVELRRSTLRLQRSGATVRLLPRLAQPGYARVLRTCDVGLALMYTPHPSLVPIEMAAAGMATVTNTLENKTAAELQQISSNLIPAEPAVKSVAAALAIAEERSADHVARARGSQLGWPTSWDDALDDERLARIERLLAL